ncbi:Phosphatidylinositol 4-kinase gamma 2 [Hibiscus syriacus]|uniref:1-phosphatidylinositol 4-kinase n=1 Tax=Hibiscus syriacus TaxID=106335 RepID=A0A6A3B1G9_HIBSY|nr:Phosphatidylinositol 4-kinase gamma 2 [Hibiscus syriacus]
MDSTFGGVIKVNVDGAFVAERRLSAIGVVARDKCGQVCGGLAQSSVGCFEAGFAELSVLLVGREFEYRTTVIVLDCIDLLMKTIWREGICQGSSNVMIKCLRREFNHPEGYEYDSKYIKIGSLQMFIDNIGSCEDMGPRAFPVEEVHKISVLDIRLANADRHAGNILVTRNSEEDRVSLIPIDHGYCLPENVGKSLLLKFEDCTFDWLYWPQAQEPYSPDVINYIKLLDAEKDIELLKFHGWDLPPKCARTFHVSTMLLKKGVERGLTPFAIGRIMCRETRKQESVIERIVRGSSGPRNE